MDRLHVPGLLTPRATALCAVAVSLSFAQAAPANPPQLSGKPEPRLIGSAAVPAVSDGARYVVFRRGDGLQVLDTRANRRTKVATSCSPVSGAYGQFLLTCGPRANAILDARTHRMLPIHSPDPGDSFNEIGRYWLRGVAAGPGADDVYFNWRTSERQAFAPGTSGIPGYAPPHDINSLGLVQAPASGEPYGLFERVGRLELRVPRTGFTEAFVRDTRTGASRKLGCGIGCLAMQLGAGRLTWADLASTSHGDTYRVYAFDWVSRRTRRWIVSRAPSLESGYSTFIVHTRHRVIFSVVGRTKEGDHGPTPVSYRIYAARWP